MKKIKFLIPLFTLLVSVSLVFAQTDSNAIKITNLTGNFYIYTTYPKINGVRIPCNGMYVVTNKGAVLFDTPWDSTQFQPLLDSIAIKHLKRVVMCISTHFHADRTAGLEYYRKKGIETYTTQATDNLSKKHNEKRAQFIIDNNTNFKLGQYGFETYFPGAGHTEDNIVIWFKKNKILYGGCLIKSIDAKDLGNLEDANVKEWSSSIINLKKKFKNAVYVVPGHGDWAGVNLLNHTLDLLNDYEENKDKRKPPVVAPPKEISKENNNGKGKPLPPSGSSNLPPQPEAKP